jgi:hypothetical protein
MMSLENRQTNFVRFGVLTAATMKMSSSGIKNPSSYFTGDTLRYLYIAQPVNANKIWGSQCGDYEECRLLGYKNTSSYFTGDTLRLRYGAQPVNANKI